jgi:hypothetical protein
MPWFFSIAAGRAYSPSSSSPGRFRQAAVEALQAGWTQEATRLKALTGMKAGSGRKTISRGKETWQKKSM